MPIRFKVIKWVIPRNRICYAIETLPLSCQMIKLEMIFGTFCIIYYITFLTSDYSVMSQDRFITYLATLSGTFYIELLPVMGRAVLSTSTRPPPGTYLYSSPMAIAPSTTIKSG